jgi:hypothetical protein
MAEYYLGMIGQIHRSSDGAYIPPDSANRDYVEYMEWVAAGGTPEPYAAPAALVPRAITPRQARLWLLSAGLLDEAEAAVTAGGRAAQITWDFATEIARDNEQLAQIAAALNITSEQIDAAFIAASQL